MVSVPVTVSQKHENLDFPWENYGFRARNGFSKARRGREARIATPPTLIPPHQKTGPCLRALPFVARAFSDLAVFAAAGPNGGPLTIPGLIHPALGLAVGGFPVGPGAGKCANSIYFKVLA